LELLLLGDRIESTALDVLERLIEATFNREWRGLLHQANLVPSEGRPAHRPPRHAYRQPDQPVLRQPPSGLARPSRPRR